MQSKNAIILAAGEGTRMKSKKPKVLCEVLFKPMISWVISACQKAEIGNICVVAGYEHQQLEAYLDNEYEIVLQKERKGTGHAVQMAEAFLQKHENEDVLVLCGDAPFIDAGTISQAYNQHKQNRHAATVISACLSDPTGYGRLVMEGNRLQKIVEEKDATAEQRQIQNVNSGAYWFDSGMLLQALGKMNNNNAKGEYYLTDVVAILNAEEKSVGYYATKNADVILGANDRKTLYTLTNIAKEKIIDKHFENGVEIVSLDGVIIGDEVKIGAGTKILPGTILKGQTVIGDNCILGPNTLIENSTIGNDTVLNATQVYESTIHNNVKIGPFCHIRPNSIIHEGVKIGDFVEVKNSTIGEKTAVAHLTYVGDSDVGKKVNFGCGCVTVNYDGEQKYRTTIKDRSFIGCNTNLIAPVTVGEGAYTAAGSTITQDVPDGALGIERAKQVIKDGFGTKKLRNRK